MLMSKIWERYFLREFIKTALFFIICFYGLYVLIDYASHTASFHRNNVHFQWREVATYYLCDFINRLDILLPFALLISSIRTLCMLNTHNELVALMSCGISLRTLMRPFVLVGLLCTIVMYINVEYLSPLALKELKHIDDTRSSKKRKTDPDASVRHIALEDHSTIVFQSFDTVQERFFDAYWIRSIDDIYRIKYLFPYLETPGAKPVGHFIDHLKRNSRGELVAVETFNTKILPDIHFNKQTLFETITPPDEQAVSTLWGKLPKAKQIASEKEAQVLSAFYEKLLLPWFCLFAIMGPAPFCLRSTRNLPMFFIYAGCIFGLVAFDVIMEAGVLLGKRQALSPFWAIWPPFVVLGGILSWRFIRLR